jgi:hypothetical protein
VRQGAKSKAKDWRGSVLRALAGHPLLERLADGRWQCIAADAESNRREPSSPAGKPKYF